jgi:phage baseplate assembly protein W
LGEEGERENLADSEEILKTDLLLSELEQGYDLTLSERLRIGPKKATKEAGDLRVVTKEYNLGQAIVMRLKTRKGELADLGHPDYGSGLYDLIGEPNNSRTRGLVRAAILEALEQEPRIKQITNVKVTTPQYDQSRVDVELRVIPADRNTPIALSFPIKLEVM